MSQAFNGPAIYGSVSGGSAPFSVTGTGLVKATAGVINAAASLLVDADVAAAAAIAPTKLGFTGTGLLKVAAGVVATAGALLLNADVDAAAAIAGSKISPVFGAQLITTTTGLSIGATPATTGLIRVPHNSLVIVGRDNANANDRNIVGWGTTTDEVIIGNVTSRTQVLGNPVATQTLTNGTIPATTGDFRVKHQWQLAGRNNANTLNANMVNFGLTTTDTLTLGDASFAGSIISSTLTFASATVVVHNTGGTTATTGNFRLGGSSWAMVSRNNANSANCNVIRTNATANALVLGDTAWGAVTLTGPGLQLISGGMSASIGTTGWIWTGSTALTSQVFWAATAVTPVIGITQQADANTGESLTIKAQQGGSTGNQNGGALILEGGAPSGSGTRGIITLTAGGLTITSTAAAAATAGAGALPATPEEFMTVTFNGNVRKIPLYLN